MSFSESVVQVTPLPIRSELKSKRSSVDQQDENSIQFGQFSEKLVMRNKRKGGRPLGSTGKFLTIY